MLGRRANDSARSKRLDVAESKSARLGRWHTVGRNGTVDRSSRARAVFTAMLAYRHRRASGRRGLYWAEHGGDRFGWLVMNNAAL